MADSKISQLTGATTPLDGTEVLPVVQSGITKQVSVANLTAGRSVATGPLAVSGTGNVSMSLSATSAGSPNFYIAPNGGGNAIISWTTGQALRLATADNASLGGFVERVKIDGSGNTTLSTGNLIQGTAGKGINFTANTPLAGMTSQLLNWYEEGTWTPSQGGGLTVVGTFSSTGKYTRVGRQVTAVGTLSGSTSIAITGAAMCSLPIAMSEVSMGSVINNAGTAAVTTYTNGITLYAVSTMASTTKIYFSVTYTI